MAPSAPSRRRHALSLAGVAAVALIDEGAAAAAAAAAAGKVPQCTAAILTRAAQATGTGDSDRALCSVQPHWRTVCLSSGLVQARPRRVCKLFGPVAARRPPRGAADHGALAEFAARLGGGCFGATAATSSEDLELDVVIRSYNPESLPYREMGVRFAALEDPDRCRRLGGLLASTERLVVFEAFPRTVEDVLAQPRAFPGWPDAVAFADGLLRHLTAGLGVAYQHGFAQGQLDASHVSVRLAAAAADGERAAIAGFALGGWDLLPVDLTPTRCVTLEQARLPRMHIAGAAGPPVRITPALYGDACTTALLVLRVLEAASGDSPAPSEASFQVEHCSDAHALQRLLDRGGAAALRARLAAWPQETNVTRLISGLLEWMLLPPEDDCFSWPALEGRLSIAAAVPLRPGLSGVGGEPPRFPWWRERFAKKENCLPKPPSNEKKGAFAVPPPGLDVEPGLREAVEAATWQGTTLFSIFVASADEEERGRFNNEQLRRWFCRIQQVLKTPLLLLVNAKHLVEEFAGVPGLLPIYPAKWWGLVEKWMPHDKDGELSDTNFDRWVFGDGILRAGFNALYADTDMVWLTEPREYLLEAPGDFMNSLDSFSGKWSSPFPDMARLRKMSKENDDESVCCQGVLGHYNAGLVFMRATENALWMLDQIRKRILMGPCWGQEAMTWTMSQHCAPQGRVQCRALDPFRFSKWELLQRQLETETRASGAGDDAPCLAALQALFPHGRLEDPPATAAKALALAQQWASAPCGPTLAFVIHLDSHDKGPMTDIADALLGVQPACAAHAASEPKAAAVAEQQGKVPDEL